MKAIHHPLVLSLLCGLLLFAAWPMSPLTWIIFFAFVPLFMLEQRAKSTMAYFLLLWLAFLIWNIATTWWIWNASPGGAVGAIVANSLLMCTPWMLFRFSKKQLGLHSALAGLVLYWLTWEYIHHHWDLSWPWLTLGNVFATHPNWVQWYEITGTTGGSLWVLLVNIFIWKAIYQPKTSQNIQKWLTSAITLLVPFLLSAWFGWRAESSLSANQTTQNVVVVQPNVEAYTEKFSTDPAILIERMIALSESVMDAKTRLIVWPETAIPVQVWEHEIDQNPIYQKVFDFVKKHPNIQLLTGIDSYKNWGNFDPGGFSSRKSNDGSYYYEAFNTAMATNNSGKMMLYHKSKLVPGVETLPSWLGFMSSVFDDLGGITGSLGTSDSAAVMHFSGNPYQPAPIICYESIYGDYVTEYVRKGANILCVITNDGWWGDTPGYKQHQSLSALRAIETRLWVARSANTGISCFINPAGTVIDAQPWDKKAAIKADIPAPAKTTFYVKQGDWLSKVAQYLTIMMLVWTLFTRFKNNKRPLRNS